MGAGASSANGREMGELVVEMAKRMREQTENDVDRIAEQRIKRRLFRLKVLPKFTHCRSCTQQQKDPRFRTVPTTLPLARNYYSCTAHYWPFLDTAPKGNKETAMPRLRRDFALLFRLPPSGAFFAARERKKNGGLSIAGVHLLRSRPKRMKRKDQKETTTGERDGLFRYSGRKKSATDDSEASTKCVSNDTAQCDSHGVLC